MGNLNFNLNRNGVALPAGKSLLHLFDTEGAKLGAIPMGADFG